MENTGRFLQAHAGSFFLFGPRGTGKSTWLRALREQALWIDMLDPETVRLFQARPERLLERIDAQPQITDVVINEVQKVPAILDVVHKLVEDDRPLPFILTGSSARKLRRGAANLMAGRLTELHMHPFMAAELVEAFDLQRALELGLVRGGARMPGGSQDGGRLPGDFGRLAAVVPLARLHPQGQTSLGCPRQVLLF